MENNFTKAPQACSYMDAFHRAVQVKPKKVAKVLFPEYPHNHRLATYFLDVLSLNKMKALQAEAKKQIPLQNAYNIACRSMWEVLPEYAKERWRTLPEETMHRIHHYAGKQYEALPGSDYEDHFSEESAKPEEDSNKYRPMATVKMQY